MPYLFVLYVALATLVAWVGRDSRLGFLKMFLLSLFITPLLTFLYILLIPYERGADSGG